MCQTLSKWKLIFMLRRRPIFLFNCNLMIHQFLILLIIQFKFQFLIQIFILHFIFNFKMLSFLILVFTFSWGIWNVYHWEISWRYLRHEVYRHWDFVGGVADVVREVWGLCWSYAAVSWFFYVLYTVGYVWFVLRYGFGKCSGFFWNDFIITFTYWKFHTSNFSFEIISISIDLMNFMIMIANILVLSYS